METSAALARKSGQPARSAALFRRISLFLAACQAAWGASGCAYAFYLSAHPALFTRPGFLPAWLPVWTAVPVLAGTWLWITILPVLLLIFGLIHVHWAAPSSWPWPVAWIGAVAAGIALEILTFTGANIDWLLRDPAYPPPAGLSWVSLAESAGFLLAGAAMTAVVIGAARSAKRRQLA